jgi:hypothetical protein
MKTTTKLISLLFLLQLPQAHSLELDIKINDNDKVTRIKLSDDSLKKLGSVEKTIHMRNREYFEGAHNAPSIFEKMNSPRYLAMSGSNIGGGLYSARFKSSEKRTISKLKELKNETQIRVDQTGDFAFGYHMLKNGLNDFVYETDNLSFTYRMIFRGIKVLESIESIEVAPDLQERSYNALYYLVLDYYKLIIKKAFPLDIGYWGPYLDRRANITADFELSFITFSIDQLRFLNHKWAKVTRTDDGMMVYPVGGFSKHYLHAAKILSVNIARDLHESIFAGRTICAVESLLTINKKLTQYLDQNNEYIYTDERFALNDTFTRIDKVIKNLKSKETCL